MQRGFWLIGESAFEGGVRVTEAQIAEHGKAVGADIVLYSSSYQGSTQTSVPFVQYNPGTTSTTYSSGAVNANVRSTAGTAYGTASYSGYSTTSTSGTYSTSVVPITMHRYAHGATFWRKLKPPIFGVHPDSLPDDLRQKLQRNTGALVKIVRDDSPAFRANVLAGDVITAIEDVEITSPKQLNDEVDKNAEKEVLVTVLRGGDVKQLKVRMNPRP